MPARVLALVPPVTVSAGSLNKAFTKLVTVRPVIEDSARSSTMVASTGLEPESKGASFTAVILIVEVVVAIRDPPGPLFPRSSIEMVSVLGALLLLADW